MALLPANVVLDISSFHWDAGGHMLSEEASTCGYTRCQRLYDDACDIGIYIKNSKTGNLEAFYLSNVDTNEDNDVLAWKFSSVNTKLNVSVTIFND